MKIAMIDGSPKLGTSNSKRLLKLFEPFIHSGNEMTHYKIGGKEPITIEQYGELCEMDALIFAFPLYADSIPSHLLRVMAEFEEHLKTKKKDGVHVYAIINNGFYESSQCKIAIEIMENWCHRCGIVFGMAVCQGSGEMLAAYENKPIERGPFKKLASALQILADKINEKGSGNSIMLNPSFPRFLWILGANSFWNKMAKKNGLAKRDVVRRM